MIALVPKIKTVAAIIPTAAAITGGYKGFVQGPSRERIKYNYRKIKRVAQGSSFMLVVAETIKEYFAEMSKDEATRQAYKYGMYLMYLLPGPLLATAGHTIYVLGDLATLRRVGKTVYNMGNTIIKGQLSLMDVPWLVSDIVLFGEYVKTWDYNPESVPLNPPLLGEIWDIDD